MRREIASVLQGNGCRALTEHPGRARRRLRAGASLSSSRVLPCRSGTVSPSNAGAPAAAAVLVRAAAGTASASVEPTGPPTRFSKAGWIYRMSCPIQLAKLGFCPLVAASNFSLPAFEVGLEKARSGPDAHPSPRGQRAKKPRGPGHRYPPQLPGTHAFPDHILPFSIRIF
ncbi:uncharacterized protein LOC143681489 [Tamandua tetradactyla]|uniref:uncharacterized protein LOC143681489 n=1 Tax=Tamandua tetradactyla TaxID=48850 RepID=UPI0040547874